MKKPKLPQTDSIQELATFWETHDFTDFEDQMERVEGPRFDRSTFVKVRLAQKEAQAVKRLARSKGVNASEIIRKWVLDKIQKS